MEKWTEKIPKSEITDKVTKATVDFAERFGKHLGEDDFKSFIDKSGNQRKTVERAKLSTSQIRKFFGEVKKQQMQGFDNTEFVLLKPKLAYAVARATGNNPKIKDFYNVLTDAIDLVEDEKHFKNFIKVFEAIVAYHKANEESKI